METVEKNVPFTRMEDVENAVWKRLKEKLRKRRGERYDLE